MLHKLMLAGVVVSGIVTGFCPRPYVEASPPTQHALSYEVLVLGPQGWESHGIYAVHAEARQEAMRLWHEGYRVMIREF